MGSAWGGKWQKTEVPMDSTAENEARRGFCWLVRFRKKSASLTRKKGQIAGAGGAGAGGRALSIVRGEKKASGEAAAKGVKSSRAWKTKSKTWRDGGGRRRRRCL